MQYKELMDLFSKARLSPELAASRLNLPGLTYQRWLTCRPDEKIPEKFDIAIAQCIYRLLKEGRLSEDTKAVTDYIDSNIVKLFSKYRRPKSPSSIGDLMWHKEKTRMNRYTEVLKTIGYYSYPNHDQKRDRGPRHLRRTYRYVGRRYITLLPIPTRRGRTSAFIEYFAQVRDMSAYMKSLQSVSLKGPHRKSRFEP